MRGNKKVYDLIVSLGGGGGIVLQPKIYACEDYGYFHILLIGLILKRRRPFIR